MARTQAEGASDAASKTSRAVKKGRGGTTSGTRPKGWGGPAKGVGKKSPRKKLDGPGPGRGKFTVAGERRKEQTYRRTESLMENLWGLAMKGKAEATRVQASVHLLNRIQGLPVQTVINAAHDDLSMMTDDELAADLERRGRKVRAFTAAVVGANVPEESDRLGD